MFNQKDTPVFDAVTAKMLKELPKEGALNLMYCNGVRRSSQPPTPLPRKGISCHHFGNYYDIFH